MRARGSLPSDSGGDVCAIQETFKRLEEVICRWKKMMNGRAQRRP